jgi:hypothetical protein
MEGRVKQSNPANRSGTMVAVFFGEAVVKDQKHRLSFREKLVSAPTRRHPQLLRLQTCRLEREDEPSACGKRGAIRMAVMLMEDD